MFAIGLVGSYFIEGHCPTFSNHSSALAGRLYRFAWARISWAKEGNTASKSARLVVEAIIEAIAKHKALTVQPGSNRTKQKHGDFPAEVPFG